METSFHNRKSIVPGNHYAVCPSSPKDALLVPSQRSGVASHDRKLVSAIVPERALNSSNNGNCVIKGEGQRFPGLKGDRGGRLTPTGERCEKGIARWPFAAEQFAEQSAGLASEMSLEGFSLIKSFDLKRYLEFSHGISCRTLRG
ncbi:hypothetical protein KM043_014973 [Ampulex compressa]|nr:hypothetical protein KM043_014973 [Ampulex compressa]